MTEPPVPAVRHAQWELPEVVAAVILLVFVVLTVTSVVVGVVAAVGQEGGLTSAQLVGYAMQSATTWANPAFAFVLLVGVGLVWWQVRIWSAEIELAGSGDNPDVEPDDDADSAILVAAFDHLLRAKSLATWALPLLFVVLAAALANALASFLLYRGAGLGGGEVWSNHLNSIGLGLATWVLVAAGLVAALYVRTQVSYEFTMAEEAAGAVADSATAAGITAHATTTPGTITTAPGGIAPATGLRSAGADPAGTEGSGAEGG
jgi:hypothetical protein